MCNHCLMAEVHVEWVESLVWMMRLDGAIFSVDHDRTEGAVICFRATRSPYYLPLRVRSGLREDMLTRRNN